MKRRSLLLGASALFFAGDVLAQTVKRKPGEEYDPVMEAAWIHPGACRANA